jgi:Putative peptidoglycan binding domain
MAGVMTPYIVRQGDYLAKLAYGHGFDADEVWNDPKNEELRKLRPDPNILAPGDILYIREGKKDDLPVQQGTENNYTATVPKVQLQLHFQDDQGPFAGEAYEVQDLGDPIPGTTDGEGGLVVDVPVMASAFHVLFPARNVIYPVLVGDMDPIDEPSGVRKRLRHLRYYADPSRAEAPDSPEEALAALDSLAIKAFQQDHQLTPTGEIDDATRAALVAAHGS